MRLLLKSIRLKRVLLFISLRASQLEQVDHLQVLLLSLPLQVQEQAVVLAELEAQELVVLEEPAEQEQASAEWEVSVASEAWAASEAWEEWEDSQTWQQAVVHQEWEVLEERI